MTYTYAIVPLALIHEISLTPIHDGAYVSQSAGAARVRELLAAGYRWVRSEGEYAVFELAI